MSTIKSRFVKKTVPFLLILFSTLAFGQNSGIPYIKHYSQKEYKAAPQNWSIVQDNRGFIYFGNNYGVLEFDGNNWRTIGLSNKTIARSLAIDKSGRIYVGGQNEFGFLQADSTGQLYYKSLKSIISEQYRNFDDVWKIYVTADGVVFFTYNRLYYLTNNKIEVITPASGIFNLPFYVNGRLFISETGLGLFEIKNKTLLKIPKSEAASTWNITAMLPLPDDKALIVTDKKGLYIFDGTTSFTPWKTAAQDFFDHNDVFCATALHGGFAFGSIYKGLLILDHAGNPVHQLGREIGFINGPIFSMYPDQLGNLWLGLNNGIDYVEVNSPFTFFDQHTGVPGTAFTSAIHDNKVYLGTNEGLFFNHWNGKSLAKNKQFKTVENAEGQTNNLQKVNGKLLLSHHNGPFEIVGEQAIRISNHTGIWMFMPIVSNPDFIVCGTYSGLLLYNYDNGKLSFKTKIKGFNESSRVMEQDDEGNIWISHGYKGVYKLKLNKTLDAVEKIDFFNSQHGFPSNLFINVFKVKDELVFTAERGIFRYDSKLDSFVVHEELSPFFNKEKHIRKLVEDKNGDVWFSEGDDMGVLRKTPNGSFDIEKNVYKKLQGRLVAGFEHINYISPTSVIIGTNEGFVHYNSFINNTLSEKNFATFIRQVKTTSGQKDSILFNGAFFKNGYLSFSQPEKEVPVLPFSLNSVKINYSAASYNDIDKVQYQYFLEGFDKNWSEWMAQTEKEYTNLWEGEYVFHVRAKNLYDKESREAIYRFKVNPPFLRSTLAYILYGFLLLVLLILFKKLKDRSVKKAKEKLRLEQERALKLKEAQHLEEVLKGEKEIIRLNNEKLETELNHKNKELASSAIHVMHNIETIQKIRTQIQDVIDQDNDKNRLPGLRKLLKTVESELDFQNNWEQFELHFNKIHQDLLSRLRKEFPDLTHRDIKLCAYLRLNLSTKEIASLLNLSIRGVETSRYRIRKKMNLGQDDNLTDFLMKYQDKL